MKFKVVIFENLLFACRKVKGDKNIYYLQCIKHYDSGKTYNECIFISQKDYESLKTKFGEKEDK